MLDIDFLNKARPAVQTHILYTYAHGVFAPKVKAQVRELWAQRGRDFREVEYEEFRLSLRAGSPFNAAALCQYEWPLWRGRTLPLRWSGVRRRRAAAAREAELLPLRVLGSGSIPTFGSGLI